MQKLLSPAKLGPFSLRNPVVSLPFFTAYAAADGLVTPQLLSHYTRIAASGVGLVIVEASAIRDKNISPFTIRAFEPEHLAGLKRLADAIHGQGAKAVLQICHTGRFAGRPGCLAPSPVPAFGVPELMPKEMTQRDMKAVAAAFAESAAIVRQAGFDGVELHGGTGYLLASFTSPYTNRRSDEYGGSVENRARFPLQVCRAVREVVGEYPVGYRFMAREYIEGGLGLEEGVTIAALIAEATTPAYLSVTAGMHECFAKLAESKQKAPEGFMLPEAEAVKKALPEVPVIAAGMLQNGDVCGKALQSGVADGVGLGRVLFADMNWLRKVAGTMKEEIRPCVQCNNCVRQIGKGSPAFCSRWSKEEKREFLKDVPPERAPQK